MENGFDGMSVGLKSLNANKLYYTYYNHENKYPKSLNNRSFFFTLQINSFYSKFKINIYSKNCLYNATERKAYRIFI